MTSKRRRRRSINFGERKEFGRPFCCSAFVPPVFSALPPPRPRQPPPPQPQCPTFDSISWRWHGNNLSLFILSTDGPPSRRRRRRSEQRKSNLSQRPFRYSRPTMEMGEEGRACVCPAAACLPKCLPGRSVGRSVGPKAEISRIWDQGRKGEGD